jgi:hypothetical protein
MMKHEELVAKEEAMEEATNTVAILKAENYELRRAVDSLKTQYEAKLDEIKTLISHGLESENDAKENIKLGLKIIGEKKVDVKVLTREWIKVDKSRPKLDSNTPSFSGKDGERLDEWLFVMNTAFESLKVMDGKERLNMAKVYVKEGPLKALMAYTKNSVKPDWNGFQEILRSQFEPRLLEMKVRTQLRHLRQTDSLQRYLTRFKELTVQLKNMSEESKLTAFIDGLKEEYKFALLTAHCDSLAKAVDVACSLDFCVNNGEQIELNLVKNLNVFKRINNRKSGYEYQESLERDSISDTSNRQGTSNSNPETRKKCYRCCRKGHIAKDCRVILPDDEEDDSEKEICSNVMGFLGLNKSISLKCVTGTVNKVNMKMALDSGATRSIILMKVARLNNFNILASNTKIKIATDELKFVVGITEPMEVNVQGHTCILELYVINHEDHDLLLGLDWFLTSEAEFCPSRGFLRLNRKIVYLENYEKVGKRKAVEELLLSEFSIGPDSEDIKEKTFRPCMIDHDKEYYQKFIKNGEEAEEARKRGNISFSRKVNAKRQLNEKKTYGNKIRLMIDQIKMAYGLEGINRINTREIKHDMLDVVKMLSCMLWSQPKMVMSILEGVVKVADFCCLTKSRQFSMNDEDATDGDGKASKWLSVRKRNQSNELMLVYQTRSIGNQSNELMPRRSSHFNASKTSSQLKNSICCNIVGLKGVLKNFALTILVILTYSYSGKILYLIRKKAYNSCGSGFRIQCNQISLIKEQKAKKECVETEMPLHKWKLIKRKEYKA